MPWYIAHGPVIAWLLVVAVACAPFAALRAWRRRGDTRAARADARTAAIALGAPAEGPISLRGTLRGGRAATLVRVRQEHHARDAELWLDHDGERIDLVGAIRVARGSHGTAGWLVAPRGTRAHGLPATERGPRTLYAVRAGDRVIVKGTARRQASSYREQGWALAGDADGEQRALELVAEHPRGVAPALAPLTAAILAVVFGAGSYVGLRALGRHELRELEDNSSESSAIRGAGLVVVDSSAQRVPLRWHDPIALAAMLPTARAHVLRDLYVLAGRAQLRGEDNLALRRAIQRETHGLAVIGREHVQRVPSACEGEAGELIDQQRLNDALALHCGPASDAEALAGLGRFAEAAAIPPGPDEPPRTFALLAAGRWPEAGAALGDECFGLLARAYAGEAAAGDQLHARAADKPACAFADALVHEGQDRTALLALASTGADGMTAYYNQLEDDLRWALDPVAPATDAAPDLVRLALADDARDADSAVRRIWLAELATDTAFDLDAYRTLRAIDRGDFAAARRAAAAAAAMHPELAAVVQLREHGRGERRLGCTRGVEPSDGAAIGAALLACPDPWQADALLATLARVTSHRDALQRALHVLVADSGAVRWGASPLRTARRAALVRDALRIAGDDAEAARWQAVVERHQAAAADPRRLFALLLVGGV